MTTTYDELRAPTVILGEHTVLADALLRVLPHTNKPGPKDHATMLAHLVVESDGTLAATNGTTIAAYRGAVQPAPGVRFLIELPDSDSHTMMVRLAKKAAKEEPLFGVTIGPSGQTIVCTVGRESLTTTPTSLADDFPDWRNLFRKMRDNKTRSLLSPQIGLGGRFLDLFGGQMRLSFGGAEHAVVVQYVMEPNFWGAVMPFRIDEDATLDTFPAWCGANDGGAE